MGDCLLGFISRHCCACGCRVPGSGSSVVDNPSNEDAGILAVQIRSIYVDDGRFFLVAVSEMSGVVQEGDLIWLSSSRYASLLLNCGVLLKEVLP